MGLETATYISGLNASNPVDATDLVNQGDDHLRLVKSTLLNTFPNITGAMTKSHTELNNAAILTAAANDFTGTDEPALDDNSNVINIGTLAGTHLAFGPSIIQAKSDADAAGALDINPLGGNVLIGPQSGSGLVYLYNGGDVVVSTHSAGLDISSTVANTRLQLIDGDAETAILQKHSSGPLYLRNEENEGLVHIQGANTGGSNTDLLVGDPDGSAGLYHAGSLSLATESTGAAAYAQGAGVAGILRIYDGDGDQGYIRKRADNGHLEFNNTTHGAHVLLRGETTGGVLTTLVQADPDGAVELKHTGDTTFLTQSTGAAVRDKSGSQAVLQLQESDTSLLGYLTMSPSSVQLLGNVNSQTLDIRSKDSGGSASIMLTGDPDGHLVGYYDGVETFRTAPYGAASQISGADVMDGGGAYRPVGFNLMPVEDVTGAITLNDNRAGWLIRITSGSGDIDLTTAASGATPIGTTWMVRNYSGGANTIDANSGVTLRWADGAGGANGDRTLADGGVCTIVHLGSSVFDIWGVGLS